MFYPGSHFSSYHGWEKHWLSDNSKLQTAADKRWWQRGTLTLSSGVILSLPVSGKEPQVNAIKKLYSIILITQRHQIYGIDAFMKHYKCL